jgi:L-ascorbate metabolism protein UlaG (beta-lactamase superfamily)
MKIKWLGHASFLITAANNIKIVTDPYNTGKGINYRPISETGDIVTISHSHGDHNNDTAVKGSPIILREKGRHIVQDIEFTAVQVFHDRTLGSQRGSVLVFCFKVDGLVVCHAGDLGHTLSSREIDEIGPVDILMLPVGGYYTIDAGEAGIVALSLKPHVVLPMHYKTDKTEYPIAGVQPFLKDRENVRELDVSEIEIRRASLPKMTETIVLRSAN